MWIVRPQLFFSCTLFPLDVTVDCYKKSADDIPIDLFFSVPLRTFAYASQAPWSPTESESFTSPPPFPPSMLARLRIFLVEYHYFHASLMAAPPPPFQTSTLRDRVGTSNSAVLTDLAMLLKQHACLSVAKTEKICKRCRGDAAKSAWETLRRARKRAAEADVDI